MGKGLWCLVIAVAIGVGWHLGRPAQPFHHQLAGEVGKRGSLVSDRGAMARSVVKLMQVSEGSLIARLEKALDVSETGASFEVQLLLARAYEEDREALRSWVLRHQRGALDILARLWLRENPEDIWLGGRHSSRTTWDNAMTKALAAEDPERFFELYAEKNRLKEGHSSLMLATQSLAQRDFGRAEKIVAGIENRSAATQALIGLALAKARNSSFEEAYAWASGLERYPETALAAVIDSLSKTDVERALALFLKSGLSDMDSLPYEVRRETRKQLARLPRDEVAALLEVSPVKAFASLGMRELPSDPLEAVAELGERESVSHSWEPRVERDALETTLSALAAQPESFAHQRMLKQTLQTQARMNSDIVADWIANFPDPEARSGLALQAIGAISSQQVPQLVNLVDLEENRDWMRYSASRAAQRMTRQSPREAFHMASQIEDAEIRSFALSQVEKIWREYDETASLSTLQLELDRENVITPADAP